MHIRVLSRPVSREVTLAVLPVFRHLVAHDARYRAQDEQERKFASLVNPSKDYSKFEVVEAEEDFEQVY